MTPRIARLRADLAADQRAWTRQMDVLDGADPLAAPDAGNLALVAWSLHHSYCALESIFERVARVLEGGVPDGPDWHRDLLDGALREIPAVRPALLPVALAASLHDLRGFRHVVRHAYDVDLVPGQLAVVRTNALTARPQVDAGLTAFDRWLEALAATG